MTKEELQKIIDLFDEEKLKREAIFGIHTADGGYHESYVQANQEGLELFALQLLKAARDTGDTLADNENSVIPLSPEEDWMDDSSSTVITHIEPIAWKQDAQPKMEYKEALFDKLVPYGCGLIMIILAMAAIVGLVTIYKWL